jgi:hypothetical protein
MASKTLSFLDGDKNLSTEPHSFSNSPKTIAKDEERMAELERMVGRLAMQVEAAKKVFGVSSFPTKEND